MRIAYVTFGCRLNRAEALDQAALLSTRGCETVTLEDSPDCVIVRACSVTAKAERDTGKAVAHLRARFPKVLVTGCFSGALNRVQLERELRGLVSFQDGLGIPVPRETSRAYLKVQDGCSGHCAFCIVPQFRGKPQSLPLDYVCARAHDFLDAGFRELVITGCNLALWHEGTRGLGDLVTLLANLPCSAAEEPLGFRIRLGSVEPGLCDDALLEVFAACPNVCRYLHLSVQSASPAVLTRMARPYTYEKLTQFIEAIRRRFGLDFALGADIITGFPGETEEDFELTRAFLARYDFVHLHVFAYSERPGTPAAFFPDCVPVSQRRMRAKILAVEARERLKAFKRRFVGRRVTVCVERDGMGWTESYLRCGPLPSGTVRRSLVRGTLDACGRLIIN